MNNDNREKYNYDNNVYIQVTIIINISECVKQCRERTNSSNTSSKKHRRCMPTALSTTSCNITPSPSPYINISQYSMKSIFFDMVAVEVALIDVHILFLHYFKFLGQSCVTIDFCHNSKSVYH